MVVDLVLLQRSAGFFFLLFLIMLQGYRTLLLGLHSSRSHSGVGDIYSLTGCDIWSDVVLRKLIKTFSGTEH